MWLLALAFGALIVLLFHVVLRPALLHLMRRKKSPSTPTAHMSLKDACTILELDADASKDAIQKRYQQLMQTIHPDAGGTHYFASQLNLARDTLLAHVKDSS